MNKCMFIFVLTIVMSSVVHGLSDDFEDGVIDTSLWIVGGEKRSYLEMPVGSWSCSHEKIMGADGYLRTRVWGPTSGVTYGHDAWVRTTYNFNDGKSYLVNFTWEAEVVGEGWVDFYFIQITDGYTPTNANYNWPIVNPPVGTTDLLWHESGSGDPVNGWTLLNGMAKTSMSIEIIPDGTVRLYDSPNGAGTLLHQGSLNPSVEWYIRFMVIDATSAGHPAGDSRLNLYDFSVNVIPVEVEIDIKPGSCPNPLNVNNKGILPVAILGTEDLDIFTINPASIRLADVAPIRSSYEDVAAPLSDKRDDCECTTEGPDGYLDLTLKFNAQDIVDALGEVKDGDVLQLNLTGTLLEDFGGTPIEGTDCVVIISKGGKNK